MTITIEYSPIRRAIAALMVCVLTLTACAEGMGGPPLTPAQMQLKQANDRFNKTVVEGAAVGAVALGLAGGVLGAMVGGRNGALLGAAAGAALGGAIGAAVGYDTAKKNYAQAKTEENLKKWIAEANQDAAAYQKSAVASREVAAEARQKIAALDAQYKAKTITVAEYQRNVASYRESDKIVTSQISQLDTKITAFRNDAQSIQGPDRQALLEDTRQMDESRRALRQSHEALAAAIAMAPAS